MPTCPEGHASDAGDYCDVCGSPVAPQSTTADTSSRQVVPGMRGADQRTVL